MAVAPHFLHFGQTFVSAARNAAKPRAVTNGSPLDPVLMEVQPDENV
jgi:hypothetical protein